MIIQFGHNDYGALNEEPPGSTRPLRARGTIPGIGDESEEIDNVVTGKHENVYTFGWYLRKMIADTRSQGRHADADDARRCATTGGRAHRLPGEYLSNWTWQTALNGKVAFVDLSRIIADRYQREGPEAVKAPVRSGRRAHELAGAEANAADAVSGLRAAAPPEFRSSFRAPAGRSRPTPGP